MMYLLGVDGGSREIQAMITHLNGEVVSEYKHIAGENLIDSIEYVIKQCLTSAGLSIQHVLYAVIGLPFIENEDEFHLGYEMIEDIIPIPFELVLDLVLPLKALKLDRGIVLLNGNNPSCYGKSKMGKEKILRSQDGGMTNDELIENVIELLQECDDIPVILVNHDQVINPKYHVNYLKKAPVLGAIKIAIDSLR